MKVYVVQYYNGESLNVDKIFSNKDDADEYCKKMNELNCLDCWDYDYQEMEVE